MPIQKEVLTLNDKVKFDNKGGAILGVLEGPVADFEHPTRNGRLYGEKLWENVIHNPLVMEQFKNGGIVGELDHPADRDDICTEKVAVIMPEPPVKNPKDGKYYGKFNILDTPCGRIVHTLAKAGFKLGVSSRGTGDVDDYTEEVDPDTYEFTCFDVVLLPAVESARMNLVTESLDTKKVNYKKLLKEELNKANEKDRAIMEDTLNHLSDKLGESWEDLKPNKEGDNKEIGTEKVEKLPTDSHSLNESTAKDKDDKEKAEEKDAVDDKSTEEFPDLEIDQELLEPETLDDIELEKESPELEISDDKLIEFLHKFLDDEGLELDGEGDEEKHFIELFHEIVCPNCSNTDEKSVEDIPEEDVQDKKPEVEDSESDELLEQLQKLLKENVSLKNDVKKLQAEKAVSGTKVSKLEEQLNSFKTIAARAGKKAIEVKSQGEKAESLINENKSLKEQLADTKKKIALQESKIDTLIKSRDDLTNKSIADHKQVSSLTESLNEAKRDSDKKLTEANDKIVKAKKLIEKYKNLAHDTATRYIERRALALGISANEIINRLNESYTLDDVDNVCEQLQDYSLNISRLPFAFDKPGKAKVRMREDRSKDPLRTIDSQYDDTVDDYLLELAGLK